ncbi:hypothetical protein [Hyalangium versicolor]|uniref:hypothetical protein n=1 Tax=Hyalangium versicolor TaxID=2861190 RepID=UPI001CCC043F|nr:hypothetical protein [Hyalangium versicolor]
MNCLRFVLCLALLSANVGLAQVPSDAPLNEPGDSSQAPVVQELPPPPVSSAPEEAPPPPPPPGELIPHRYEPETDSRALVLPRVLSEIFGGAVGGIGMGLVGLIVSVSALENVDCEADADVCFATVAIITVPAAFVGIPMGVQMAGDGLGGRGKFLPALGGAILGMGVGAIYGMSSDDSGPLVVGLLVGPLVGAILGYEISNALESQGAHLARDASPRRKGPQVVPVVGATPRGGILGGLSATF